MLACLQYTQLTISKSDATFTNSTVENNVNDRLDKSFADDLNSKRGAVRSRVVLLLRSTEAKPLFSRFVYSLLLNLLFYFSPKIKKYLLPRCSRLFVILYKFTSLSVPFY